MEEKIMKKILFFGLVIALVFAACAKQPTEEMEKAAAAVSQAENDPDAKAYAPSSIARARESLNTMQAEADQKRYDQAKQLAADTIALAEKAIADGKSGAVRIRDEAANAINAMNNAITETETTIESARTAKQKGVNFQEIDGDFAAANAGADQARLANNQQRFREAIDGGGNVRSQLSNITARIGQSAQAQNRKK
jgi:PBP1b-binding outer membrane lipoprotein LpoB